MSFHGVQLGDQEKPSLRFNNQTPKGLTGFVIKHGWAKDKSQANVILLGIALGAFVLAFVILAFSGGSESVDAIDPGTLVEPEI